MKKQITIAEYNLDGRDRNPDNVILTLLGKYFLRFKTPNFLWKNNFVSTSSFSTFKNASLVSKNDDYLIGIKKDPNDNFVEYASIIFNLKNFFVQAPASITNDKVVNTINNLLSSSYYYGLADTVDQSKKEVWLKYGKTFYDYNTSLSLPINVPQESNENEIAKSGFLTPIAKIQPLYNYYDENYEKVAAEKDETSLFNFYSLYYYLNEQNTQDLFLNDNVFALMKNYDETFFDDYLASTKTNLLSKLKTYKSQNKENIKKTKIFIAPQALKFINEINDAKFRQPYGIEVAFPSQPVGAFSKLIKDTSYGIRLEQLILEQPSKSFDLIDRTLATKVLFKEDPINKTAQPKIEFTQEDTIRAFDINKFFNNAFQGGILGLDPLVGTFLNKSNLVLDKSIQKESPFLEQIKQKLFKDKVDELVSENFRNFSDIVVNSSAYKEVLFYEIKKYRAATSQGILVPGQLIQQIIIPNSEEVETVKYFDTQVKYNKEYFYTVTAWTMVIGNKYKYFDRTSEPKQQSNLVPDGVPVDLKQNPNFGIPVISDGKPVWNPRLHKISNNKKLKLDVGVYNQPDILLIGVPYVSPMNSRVLSAPPIPPEITFVPYKNVSNKIKVLFNNAVDRYRAFPVSIELDSEKEQETILLQYEEKTRGIKDGKITFASDDPASKFIIYKLDTKPEGYEDFANNKIEIIPSEDGYAFEDKIEPNKKYYYTFRSVDVHQLFSNPTPVYEVEIIDNSGAVYPVINVIEFKKEDARFKVLKTFSEIKLVVDPDHILEKPGDPLTTAKFIDGKLSSFGSKLFTIGDKKQNISIFGKTFKIRITSKTTKKKIDINVLFARQFKQSIEK